MTPTDSCSVPHTEIDIATAERIAVAAKAPLAAQIAIVQALLASDLARLNDTLRTELNSDVALIGEIGEYLIAAGGKRLRPMLVLLSARALGAKTLADFEKSACLAAIVELIHTATLLHDDVVDESDQRRNRKTANALWGNAASVLVGDFLYSRAFQMMLRLQNMRVMEILANATNAIAEGEVLQLIHKRDPAVSQAQYLEVIKRKTAVLFEAACRLGALCMGSDAQTEAALACYGLNLGFAFQIADDLLDYTGDASVIGKNIGDDLAEGKTTLPIIFAAARADGEDAALIERALKNGERESLGDLIRIMRSTDALDASMDIARGYVALAITALNRLPDSPERAALITLANYSVARFS
jgi:octaprenyl-diphosphate synthase